MNKTIKVTKWISVLLICLLNSPIIAQPITDSRSRVSASPNNLGQSPQFDRDSIILNQARWSKPTGASPVVIVERLRLMLRLIEQMKNDARDLGVSSKYFAQIKKHIDERSTILFFETDSQQVTAWDAQTKAQLELLNLASAGIALAKKQLTVFPWPDAKKALQNIANEFALVVEHSETVMTAGRILNLANTRSRQFPITLMSYIMETLRKPIDEAVLQHKNQNQNLLSVLTDKEREISRQLNEITRRINNDFYIDKKSEHEEIKTLFDDILIFQLRVTAFSNVDACMMLAEALEKSESVMGEIRSHFGGGNQILREKRQEVFNHLHEWFNIGLPSSIANKQAARIVFDKKINSQEWTRLIDDVKKAITDHGIVDKWMTVGALVGVAIITGGVGAYVEAAAGVAWGTTAGFILASGTEALMFTTFSAFLINKHPSLHGFFDELGENLKIFIALRALSRIYRIAVGTEVAASVSGRIGEILVQFNFINNYALSKAAEEKKKRTGLELTENEINEITFDNFVLISAISIGSKLANPWIQRMHARGQVAGLLHSAERISSELNKIVQGIQAGNIDNNAAIKVLRAKQLEMLQVADLIVGKLESMVPQSNNMRTSILSPEQVLQIKSLRAQITDALVASKLESIGSNEFYCPKEFFEIMKKHYAAQNAKISESRDEITDAKTIEIVLNGQEPFRITERVSNQSEPINTQSTFSNEVIEQRTFRLKDVLHKIKAHIIGDRIQIKVCSECELASRKLEIFSSALKNILLPSEAAELNAIRSKLINLEQSSPHLESITKKQIAQQLETISTELENFFRVRRPDLIDIFSQLKIRGSSFLSETTNLTDLQKTCRSTLARIHDLFTNNPILLNEYDLFRLKRNLNHLLSDSESIAKDPLMDQVAISDLQFIKETGEILEISLKNRLSNNQYAGHSWVRKTTPWQRQVLQRSDIDWTLVRPSGAKLAGKTNLEAAKEGYAPGRINPRTGKWEDVVLHHMNQDPRGTIMELWRTTHGKAPHAMDPPGNWRKERPDWSEAWRDEQPSYWRWRTGRHNPPPQDKLYLPGDK